MHDILNALLHLSWTTAALFEDHTELQSSFVLTGNNRNYREELVICVENKNILTQNKYNDKHLSMKQLSCLFEC